MIQENREVKRTFRLTEDEDILLEKLARREGIDPSKYLRNIIRNQERAFTLSPDEVALLKSNFANITRLGSNINQITYHMNYKSIGGKDELLNLKETSELEMLLIGAGEALKITKDQIVKLIKQAE